MTIHHLFILQPQDTFEQFHERYNDIVLKHLIAQEQYTKSWENYASGVLYADFPNTTFPEFSIRQSIVESGGILLDDHKFVEYHDTDEQNLLT